MLTISRPAALGRVQKGALLQAKDIFEGMTEPFFDILLKSRVIVDNEEATVYFPRFVDDNSRLE